MEARSITYRQVSCGFMHLQTPVLDRVWTAFGPRDLFPCFSGPSPGVDFRPQLDLAFHTGHWRAFHAHARSAGILKCVRWEDILGFPYKREPNTRRAELAVFLLSEMADWRFIRWAREFMEDSNDSVRWNALITLGQVLQGPLGDEGIAFAKELLAKAKTDNDQRMRERAIEIRKQLASDPRLRHLEL